MGPHLSSFLFEIEMTFLSKSLKRFCPQIPVPCSLTPPPPNTHTQTKRKKEKKKKNIWLAAQFHENNWPISPDPCKIIVPSPLDPKKSMVGPNSWRRSLFHSYHFGDSIFIFWGHSTSQGGSKYIYKNVLAFLRFFFLFFTIKEKVCVIHGCVKFRCTTFIRLLTRTPSRGGSIIPGVACAGEIINPINAHAVGTRVRARAVINICKEEVCESLLKILYPSPKNSSNGAEWAGNKSQKISCSFQLLSSLSVYCEKSN